jgi:hypothetical protein
MRVPRSFRAVGLGLAVLVLPIPSSEVSAGCTLSEEASAVRKSVSRLVRCNDKRFRAGPTAECSLFDPPACAGSLVADAVALAYGANDPPAASVDTRELRDQLSCQKLVGKGGCHLRRHQATGPHPAG